MPFFSLLRRDLRELARDRWLLSLVSWIPALLFVLMIQMLSQEIPRDLLLGVVDLDKGSIARDLRRQYQASPTLDVLATFTDVQTGAAALRSGDISALVVIPADLGKDIMLGRPSQVTVFVNDQLLLIGKIIGAALLQAHNTFNAQIETGRNLFGATPLIELAISRAMVTTTQVTPLFNPNVNYAQFLVSAILPAIWQILMIVTTILSLASSRRQHTLSGWLGTTPSRSLLARFILLATLFWLQGAAFLGAMYVWLGWPMHGSWPLVLSAQLLTAWASIGAGSLFFFITSKVETSLSLAASYAAPALAFMGVTFPVTDMTLPARIWRSFLPVSHYVEVQFAQVNYGAAIMSAAPQLLALALFGLPLLLAFALAHRSLRRDREGVAP